MRKLIGLLVIIGLGYGFYHFSLKNNERLTEDFETEEEIEIKTYTNNKNLEDYEFLKNAKPPKRKEINENANTASNETSSTSLGSNIEEEGVTIEGRKVIGNDFRDLKTLPHDYVFGNEYNSNWKAMALKEFNDEEDSEAKIEIQSQESLVFVREKNAMFIEKVKITVSETDGNEGQFMAYIDSSNGEVLHAWDPASDPKGGTEGTNLFDEEDDEDFEGPEEMEHSINSIPEDFDEDE